MKLYDGQEHEFLILSYPDIGLIMNRNQFFAGIFLTDAGKIETRFRYFRLSIKYNEEKLPLFDLDTFCADHFACRRQDDLSIVLISDASLFSVEHRILYEDLILRENPDLSHRYIAVKADSKCRIESIPLSEVKQIPSGLRAKYKEKGILGCRFPAQESIHYFLDIELAIFYSFGRTEGYHENSYCG